MTETILAVLSEIRPESDFSRSADFLADGLLDSFDMVMLVSELDRRFAISIDGTDMVPENFQNAGTIGGLLRKYGVGS